LSQFGAYGAGRAGWSAQKIVTFYYTNTHIEQRPGNISVQGYGTMNLNTYVAGLGEVPDKACGNATQVAENPAKYVLDNPNTVWDCWPAETIKAQVIAARSYAASYGGTICTTAACQVYKGGQGKKWAADETKDMVIVSHGSTHNGQIIRALYSSDNNQGHGTADNDTVFSSFAGVGTPYSYLRHVNDTSFAYKFQYTSWGWRTNGYSMASITSMLKHAKTNGKLSSSQRSYISSVLSDIGGSISSLNFVRDGSQRVKKVRVTGINGVTREMAGWLFKGTWNSWIAAVKPTGQYDYIYSLTFYLLRK
jgi:SpoIID/LytB domain protein